MQVSLAQASSMSVKYIKAGLVPMLHGSPGTGKSAAIHAIAEANNLKLIDIRLSQCDPTDMVGLPSLSNGRLAYLPPMHFPLESDPFPINQTTGKPYAGWLLFLDEMNSAPMAVQASSYKIILDRMVGQEKLHKRCAIVCAGNLETDNAIVMPMSTALQSRIVHIELMNDWEEWIVWAEQHDISHMITSYIKFKPGNLYAFKPDHTDMTYACNRTWEFANRVLKVTTADDQDRLPMLAGTLSEGVAREFVSFTRIYRDLPAMADIIAKPLGTKVPDEPSILYALTGSIAHHMDETNITPMLDYIFRLPAEFQVVCLKEAIRRNNKLMQHEAIQKWINTQAKKLF